jgi:hypothetical protein
VTIPKDLLTELYIGLAKVEEALATLEELMDKKGLERIRKAKEEYREGKYVTVQSSGEIKKLDE